MIKNKRFIAWLLSLTLLSGCIQSNIIEELGIVTAYGFDKDEPGSELIEATTILFQFNPDITDASQIIHSKGHTFREIRSNANKKSGYKIVTGQLRTVVFGPNVAKEGIFPYLDNIARDASISDMIYIAMSNEPASELLSATNYEQAPNVGTYIERLINTAVRNEEIVSSTLHEYTRTFFTIGQDPLLPILTNENNKVIIQGLALMQDDRFVGTLSLEDAFYVRMIIKDFQAGQVEIALPIEKFKPYIEDYEKVTLDTLYVVMEQLFSKSEIKLVDPESFQFKININLEGRIVEITERLNMKNKKVLKMMEEEINKEIERKFKEIVLKTQELETDIFGFGKYYISSIKNVKMTKEQWREIYPSIDVDIQVKTRIRSFGIVE